MASLPWKRVTHVVHPSVYAQAVWYTTGALVAFLLPFLFSSVLDLNNDVYYLIYFAGAVSFLALYATATEVDVRGLFTRNWRWSLGLGILAAAVVAASVLSREDSTPHPDGLYFLFSIAWRGVIYGTVDALLLTAFPVAVAYALFDGRIDTLARHAGFALLALVLSMAITATYHLGYEQFREDGIAAPETGNTIMGVPAFLTANPLGSMAAHASMHVTADIHAYETDVYLPPQTFVKGDGGNYPAKVQLTEADNGRPVTLAQGGSLIVALASNPSTGFSWAVVGSLPEQLRQEGDPRFVPAGSTQPVVGAGGTEVFTFTATKAGTATLQLGYRRPFESVPPERTFSIEVDVR